MIEDLKTPDGVEFHKVAVLSASHLSPETMMYLNAEGEQLDVGENHVHPWGLIIECYEYGWRMHVRNPTDGFDPLRGSDDDGPVPDELRTIYGWALENGIAWVAFDRDGSTYEELWPTWEW